MTLDEVENLQLGDQVQMPNGVIATVKTINTSNRLVALDMPGGSETIIPGDVPPERQDVDTIIICAWADLANATKVPPEVATTLSTPPGKTAPTGKPPVLSEP